MRPALLPRVTGHVRATLHGCSRCCSAAAFARQTFPAQDPDYEAKVREVRAVRPLCDDPSPTVRPARQSFSRQIVMNTIGASLTTVQPGLVQIELPYRADLTQQHGFLHAGTAPASAALA